jgi:acid phosphatase family membrane protein YuiD
MEIISFPLLAAVIGNLSAQLAKAIVQGISKRSIAPDVLFASGGMPSSHSSTVSALATSIGLQDGFDSSTFAIAFIFTGVVAYDAMGVRLAAGKHAAALNILVAEFKILAEMAKEKHPDRGMQLIRHFHERIGHSVSEVLTGLSFGALIAYSVFHLYFQT